MTTISETAFKDWIELLTRANGLDLLQDPYGVWLEAFHSGAMLERQRCAHAVNTQVLIALPEEFDEKAAMSVAEVKQIQHSLLKQVIGLIAANHTAH